MRNKLYILILGILTITAFSNAVYAQHTYFPTQGTITYEKTMFLKNLLKRYGDYSKEEQIKNHFYESAKATPENVVFKKTLTFNNDEIRYDHVAEEYSDVVQGMMRMGVIESGLNSYQNLKTKEFKSFFELGGQGIQVQDSVINPKWKITNEYRNIAGYTCRRANGIVLDSIYVVAFYTDEIPVSGGPSCFRGLPGMILGLAVPELHYNMFATKVDLTPVPFVDPALTKKKVKGLTRKSVYDQINSTVGSYLGEKIFNLVMAGYYL